MAGEYEGWAYLSWNETSEVWDEGPGPDTSIFFDLRELVRVDLSRNKLSGEMDILFAPVLEYVNLSHNNFTSIDSFKVSELATACVIDLQLDFGNNMTFSSPTCFDVHVSNSRSLMVRSLLPM